MDDAQLKLDTLVRELQDKFQPDKPGYTRPTKAQKSWPTVDVHGGIMSDDKWAVIVIHVTALGEGDGLDRVHRLCLQHIRKSWPTKPCFPKGINRPRHLVDKSGHIMVYLAIGPERTPKHFAAFYPNPLP